MKKLWITLALLLVAVPLAAGGYVWYTYNGLTQEEAMPAPSAMVLGTSLAPVGAQWHQPLFGGLLYKHFETPPGETAQDAGTIHEYSITASGPAGYVSEAVLAQNGVGEVWRGKPEDVSGYTFTKNGAYTLEIESELPQKDKEAYGRFAYRATFMVDIQPELITSSTEVKQGDVLAIGVTNMLEAFPVTGQTDTEGVLITFAPVGAHTAVAFVAVTHNRPTGEYTVHVEGGGYSWDVPYTVVEAEFEKQNLIIDTSNPVISEAASPKAYQQYRDKIYPLFEQADEEIYWNGNFIWPVEARLSTTYGLFRYTNGSTTPSRHSGIDIAADADSPIVAPAAGRVVLAEYLLNTGWTIVIEHGGGLKSYYYHMNEIAVEPGQMVEQGQNIGKVGSTGYSTGAHLHFEMRIGTQTLNPMLLFDGTGALYNFDEK